MGGHPCVSDERVRAASVSAHILMPAPEGKDQTEPLVDDACGGSTVDSMSFYAL